MRSPRFRCFVRFGSTETCCEVASSNSYTQLRAKGGCPHPAPQGGWDGRPSPTRTVQNQDNMREYYDNERFDIEPDEYYDRSGCGPIVAVLAVIALFWVVVGGICLFT